MARYRYEALRTFLISRGCYSEGDASALVTGWYGPDGIPFTFPIPAEGWVDANIVDLILIDRWIWTGPMPIRRYPD